MIRKPTPQYSTAAEWFNPRRWNQVERLLRHIAWHGMKMHLNEDGYQRLLDEEEMRPYQVDQAADDAWQLGLVEMSWTGGGWIILKVLSQDIDRAAHSPISLGNRGVA